MADRRPARHRAHHADPRDVPLIFIPWQTQLWLLAYCLDPGGHVIAFAAAK